MVKLTLRRIACIAVAILAAACGSEYRAPEVTSNGPFAFSKDTGAGGASSDLSEASTSYLSEFRTATDRALLRKRLAARTFSIPEDQVDALVNYSYNDWGQGHDCAKGGYYGGHAGIDYQTKSVEGTATAEVSIYSISAGTFVAFRTHTWGITAIVRSRVPDAATGQDQDVYFHYLHLRSANQNLRPGDALSPTSTHLGIQGSPRPGDQNYAEHVHLEVALEELEFGHGAHPSLCGDSTGATLDPYPILAGLFDGGSPAGTDSSKVDGNDQPSRDSGGGGGAVPVIFVHGINSGSAIWANFRDKLISSNVRYGGSPKVSNGSVSNIDPGDFYTLDFSSSNGLTFQQQGWELAKIIAEVKRVNNAAKVILVAHSMGGLASRAYLQSFARSQTDGSFPYSNDVERLITVGTPHRGSPWPFLCQGVIPVNILCELILGGDSIAMNMLKPDSVELELLNSNTRNLPPINYVSIVVDGKSLSIAGSDDDGDGIVSVNSQTLASVILPINISLLHKALPSIYIDPWCAPQYLGAESHTCEPSNLSVQGAIISELQGTSLKLP